METVTDQPLLLSVKGVARALDCSRSKAYELIASGELESLRLGGLRRVPHAALLAYIEKLRDSKGAA